MKQFAVCFLDAEGKEREEEVSFRDDPAYKKKGVKEQTHRFFFHLHKT